jgi:hypothetical protein
LIDVTGLVSTGAAAAGPFFGAELTPFLDNTSTTDTWFFSETVVTAPIAAGRARAPPNGGIDNQYICGERALPPARRRRSAIRRRRTTRGRSYHFFPRRAKWKRSC